VFTPPKLFYSSDTIKLQCFYDSTGISGPTYGGTATTNEMCQVYLYYYPASSTPLTSVVAYPAAPPSNSVLYSGTSSTYATIGTTAAGQSKAFVNQTADVLPANIDQLPTCTTTFSRVASIGTTDTQYIANINQFNPNAYAHSQVLDNLGIYKLYWNITLYNDGSQNGIVNFAAEVETMGWIGSGISLTGDMYSSDVIIGWVDNVGQTVSILDRKVTVEHVQPPPDQSQDIFNIRGYKGLYPKAEPNLADNIYWNSPNIYPETPTVPTPETVAPMSSTGSATTPTTPMAFVVAVLAYFSLVIFCVYL